MSLARFKWIGGSSMEKILKSNGARDLCTDKANAVLSAAQSAAPVASGEYRNSLHIEQATTDRAAVRVVANAPHALVVEANFGVLARAIDAG